MGQQTPLSRGVEDELRRLCFWYELSGQTEAAGVLQAAADAARLNSLGAEAADALISLWQPFAGLEAQVGNPPTVMTIAETDEELERAIIADMRRAVAEQTNPARRVYFARLLAEQIEIFSRGNHE